MAKKEVLKHRITGETIYPITHSNCIITEDSSNVATEKTIALKIADTLESSPEIVEAVTELKDKLQDDNDVAISVEKQIAVAKRQVFDDLWDSATGDYGGKEPGHMEGNELKEYHCNGVYMNQEEAMDCYNFSMRGFYTASMAGTSIRTNIFPWRKTVTFGWGYGNDNFCNVIFRDAWNIEVIRMTAKETDQIRLLEIYGLFASCKKLRKIIGIMIFASPRTSGIKIFQGCDLLEDVKLISIYKTCDFLGAPKLSAESVRYMVQNAANTSTITFTYHADVYAKIIANEGEWAGILDLAQSKNISIASA